MSHLFPNFRKILIFPIKVYQVIVSPIIHVVLIGGCKFQPTCSEYAVMAIGKYGVFRGGFLGLKRVFRCHPWSEGGVDLP